MMSSVKSNSFLGRLFGDSSWVGENDPAPSYYVAAGNPVTTPSPDSNPGDTLERPEALRKFAGTGVGFIVAGNSMRPKGIENTDALVCRDIEVEARSRIKSHTFIVIKVDKEWYKNNRQSVAFDFKLRYTLDTFRGDCNFEDFYEQIKQKEDSVLLPKNRRELKKKFEEALKWYGKERTFILSLTYKEGATHYSIHPAEFALYEVIGLGKATPEGIWNNAAFPPAA